MLFFIVSCNISFTPCDILLIGKLYGRFISIPKDMGAFNCGAFVAGIVRVHTALTRAFLMIVMLLVERSKRFLQS